MSEWVLHVKITNKNWQMFWSWVNNNYSISKMRNGDRYVVYREIVRELYRSTFLKI